MRTRGLAAVAAVVVLLAGCSGGSEPNEPAVSPEAAAGVEVCQAIAAADVRERVAQLGWDASETLDNAYYERVSDLDGEIADLLTQARDAEDVHAALTALRKPLQDIRQAVNSGVETFEIDASTMVTAGTDLLSACSAVGVDLP